MYLATFLVSLVIIQIDQVMSRPKSWREGPIVDPGVFVITQIKECRNRMGYCILGHSCNVDTDFVADDLGGHCDRLSKAFQPEASFVCCKQNPELFQEDPSDNLEAIILENNINHATSGVSVAGIMITSNEDTSIFTVTEGVVENEKEESSDKTTSSEEMTATELITELYTETDTTVEDVTKVVMEDLIVD